MTFKDFQSPLIKAFPLDAGTDNGFTFTSPNWETEPRGEVFQITNRFLLLRICQKLSIW